MRSAGIAGTCHRLPNRSCGERVVAHVAVYGQPIIGVFQRHVISWIAATTITRDCGLWNQYLPCLGKFFGRRDFIARLLPLLAGSHRRWGSKLMRNNGVGHPYQQTGDAEYIEDERKPVIHEMHVSRL